MLLNKKGNEAVKVSEFTIRELNLCRKQIQIEAGIKRLANGSSKQVRV